MLKTRSVFLDTNIWIYAYSNTEKEKRDIVLKLLNEGRVCLSSQVVNEFIWVMSRKYRVDFDTLGKIIEGLFDMYPIDLPDRYTIVKATGISKKFSFSYWDSLMVASALKQECSILFTEDLHHGQRIENRLTIQNPFILL
ncbi:MAG: PIN domain-containing protein [Desulfuromonadales bacterium]